MNALVRCHVRVLGINRFADYNTKSPKSLEQAKPTVIEATEDEQPQRRSAVEARCSRLCSNRQS